VVEKNNKQIASRGEYKFGFINTIELNFYLINESKFN